MNVVDIGDLSGDGREGYLISTLSGGGMNFSHSILEIQPVKSLVLQQFHSYHLVFNLMGFPI